MWIWNECVQYFTIYDWAKTTAFFRSQKNVADKLIFWSSSRSYCPLPYQFLKIFIFCFVLFTFIFLWFITILSEFDELDLEDVSGLDLLLDDKLDVKELKNDGELRYFRFQEFLVLDLLLLWFSLESFVSLGTWAVWAESQCPQKEACQPGDLTFSCGVYESRLFTFFSPFFSPGCLGKFPGVEDIAWLSGVWVSTFSPTLFNLLSVTGSLQPSLKMFSKSEETRAGQSSIIIYKKVGSKCKIVERFYKIKLKIAWHAEWSRF